MILKVLAVDDDPDIRSQIERLYNNKEVLDHRLQVVAVKSFEEAIEEVNNNDYDLAILDLCEGEPSENSKKPGYDVLSKIQSYAYIPVIFYSGLAYSLEDLKSSIVGIVSKGDGFEALDSEIERIIKSNLGLIKQQVYKHVKESLREFFWNAVHEKKEIYSIENDDISLGYLLLRRLAHSLSKENIKDILQDKNIKADKTHPMEFYIYPHTDEEYGAGDILSLDDEIYVILTPSCDFVEDTQNRRKRKAEMVLLAQAIQLECTDEYKNYIENKGKENKQKLSKLIETRKSDRFFFLPGTHFIKNCVLDFQFKTIVPYERLSSFNKVARLDEPFAQSMIASFIRHYNRIGFPDIDSELVLSKL